MAAGNRWQGCLVLAALAATADSACAQAGLQFYGVVDAYVGRRQFAGAPRTTVVDSGGMTLTQWGVRGAEPLGGELVALFDLSGIVRADSGEPGRFPGDPFIGRLVFVGLRSGWGTFRLGRIPTPNFGATVRLNPFGDSFFSPMLMHTYIGGQPLEAAVASGGPASISDSAHSNAIAYSTPEAGGFAASVQLSLGEVDNRTSANRRVAYGVTYGRGPLQAALTGETVRQPTLPPPPVVPAANQKQGQETLQAGAAYDFGILRAFAQHSRTSIDLPGGGQRDFRTSQLGLGVPAGGGRVLASVAGTRRSGTAAADLRRTTRALGYDYVLSTRTDMYVIVLRDSVTGLRDGTSLVAGVRHRF